MCAVAYLRSGGWLGTGALCGGRTLHLRRRLGLGLRGLIAGRRVGGGRDAERGAHHGVDARREGARLLERVAGGQECRVLEVPSCKSYTQYVKAFMDATNGDMTDYQGIVKLLVEQHRQQCRPLDSPSAGHGRRTSPQP